MPTKQWATGRSSQGGQDWEGSEGIRIRVARELRTLTPGFQSKVPHPGNPLHLQQTQEGWSHRWKHALPKTGRQKLHGVLGFPDSAGDQCPVWGQGRGVPASCVVQPLHRLGTLLHLSPPVSLIGLAFPGWVTHQACQLTYGGISSQLCPLALIFHLENVHSDPAWGVVQVK